jgi:hypothetical protein
MTGRVRELDLGSDMWRYSRCGFVSLYSIVQFGLEDRLGEVPIL